MARQSGRRLKIQTERALAAHGVGQASPARAAPARDVAAEWDAMVKVGRRISVLCTAFDGANTAGAHWTSYSRTDIQVDGRKFEVWAPAHDMNILKRSREIPFQMTGLPERHDLGSRRPYGQKSERFYGAPVLNDLILGT